MARAKTKATEALPEHLEALLGLLESQNSPDRSGALAEIEERFGVEVDLSDAQAEHEEFADRYRKWWRRIQMGLEDKAVASALNGKGSATTILRGMGALQGAGGGNGGGGEGRLVLERSHAGRVSDFKKGW
jgi:hypothetical protein